MTGSLSQLWMAIAKIADAKLNFLARGAIKDFVPFNAQPNRQP